MMFLLIMTGFLLRKFGFITDAGKKSITDILLYAILPCNIIKAFTTELGTDHWNDFAILLAIAIFVQIMALFICRFMYNRMNPGEKEVYQYARWIYTGVDRYKITAWRRLGFPVH